MRETTFIARNQEKWERYEAGLAGKDQDPELLGELYVHTTDDLSYSRTFYANRSVRVYLNGLAQRTLLELYRGRRGESHRFLTFWTQELPLVIHRQRRYLRAALVIFALAMVIGIVSYRIDPSFANLIMGDYYMEMTQENIERGDPMAVYKQMEPFEMALHITLNNIWVALLTFVSGAFFAVGAVVQLVRNGVMLGTFQYFFYDVTPKETMVALSPATEAAVSAVARVVGGGSGGLESVLSELIRVFSTGGVFRESLLTIWIHGALEISSIVIAGGAGIAMGAGLLFPGTLSRWQAFRSSARDGLKIMLGTLPLFVVAGFLEGYITRQTETPDIIRLFFILACFGFIIYYYVALPRRVAARSITSMREGVASRGGVRDTSVDIFTIRTSGSILATTLRVFRTHLPYFLGGIALISAVFCLYSFLFAGGSASNRYYFENWLLSDIVNIHLLTSTWGQGRGIGYFLLVAAGFYGLMRLSFELLLRSTGLDISPAGVTSEAFLFASSLVVAGCFAFSLAMTGLLLFLFFPFLMIAVYGSYHGWRDIGRLAHYVYQNMAISYPNFLLIFLFYLPAMWLLDTTIGRLLFATLDWIFYADGATLDSINVILQAFVYYFLFGILFCLWSINFALCFYTLVEIGEATGLRQRLATVGRQRRIGGMEAEGETLDGR